jgi:4-hydroxy 2-oxovalerate aldolase
MNQLRIIDTTLRDGMHAVEHSFTPQEAAKIAKGLEKAGANTIEVAHGDGIGGSSFQYGKAKSSDEELIAAVASVCKNAKVAALLIPGIGTIEDLKRVYKSGVRTIRVATHVTEADVAQQHIEYAKTNGMETIGFLMMTHMVEPKIILEQAKLMQSYGADMIYLADSAGAMIPSQVIDRVKILKEYLDIPVGFHAHNNLGLAIGNTIAAIEAGVNSVDTTLCGIGASAGNAPHEVLIAALLKMDIDCNEELYAMQDVAEDVVRPLMKHPLVIDKYALTIGYAGVYGSFFLHAKRAADRFGIDARDILIELGRLKTVGGQEDMIVDVAYKLSQRRR